MPIADTCDGNADLFKSKEARGTKKCIADYDVVVLVDPIGKGGKLVKEVR